jgi:uncharacterized protein YbaP (TraB family)
MIKTNLLPPDAQRKLEELAVEFAKSREKTTLFLRIPADVKSRLETLAAGLKVPLNELCTMILTQAVEHLYQSNPQQAGDTQASTTLDQTATRRSKRRQKPVA